MIDKVIVMGIIETQTVGSIRHVYGMVL